MQAQEQINLFIAEQPEWQRKLLVRLRKLIHASDEHIEETWRSNTPHFEQCGVVVSMHALKTCVSVWFPKGAQLKDPHGLFQLTEKDETRETRKYKVHEGEEINEKAFQDLLKQTLKLHATAKNMDPKPSRRSLEIPAELEQVLCNDAEALAQWKKFSADQKQEYVEWVSDAKQEESRKRRIAKALEMIREGHCMKDAYNVG
jgi:hypothetical protein